ncbi:hypothetical protein R2601_03443 [Salipiger bermudensis HTCC2601]|uniref:Uncharacterized protein n=1 Tax=Salipiger bermudensis (strain DSM 26914 / JCM 13377 / KCTC 12554 / HTCC2601) TaxID=314265 RepID=Q0FWF7_SALBH|nr:hypothetical protein R2601_03443 [Salipiger bermudensis HTCC2601]
MCRHRPCRIAVEIGKDHARTLRREQRGRRGPDAAGTAGNEGGAP